jgi:hypothetical protein
LQYRRTAVTAATWRKPKPCGTAQEQKLKYSLPKVKKSIKCSTIALSLERKGSGDKASDIDGVITSICQYEKGAIPLWVDGCCNNDDGNTVLY